MYHWLKPRVGERGALLIAGLWYGVLVLLIALLSSQPAGDFRYDDL